MPDYSKLAQQFGGASQSAGVDYAALARQYAGTPADDEKSVGGFVENIGTSAGNLVGNVAALLKPSTWAGVIDRWNEAREADLEALRRGERQPERPAPLRDRYGSPSKALNTLYSDPVGVAVEVLGLAPTGVLKGAVAGGVRATGKKMVNLAPRAVQAAVKPTVAELRKQTGASVTGLEGQAKRVTGLLLRNRWKNADQASDAIRSTEKELQTVLQGSTTPLDTATRVPRYLKQLERSAQAKIAPGGDPATIRRATDDVLNGALAEDVVTTTMQPSPSGLVDQFGKPVLVPVQQTSRALRTDVTPVEGLTAARAQGRWGNRKAWGEMKGAEQEASKAAEIAVRDSVKAAVSAAKPLLRKQGDALTLKPILDRMALRQSNRDMVGLPAWVTAGPELAAGKVPLTAMAAQFFRNQQLPIGYALDDAGRALMKRSGKVGSLAPGALRSALMALLADDPSASGPTR